MNPSSFAFRFAVLMSTLWLLAALSACQQPGPASNSSGGSDTVLVNRGPKIGYVNSMELLSLMPEAQSAEQELASYAQGQQNRFNSLAQQYQSKVQKFQQEAETMFRADQERAVKEISSLEQQIQEMQASSQQRVAQRREELFAPVLSRADSIIQKVAKDNGYDMIYDAPGLLYADSAMNVLPLIKAAMGIEDTIAPADSAASGAPGVKATPNS
jgi:outer membrane protein